jgi:fibronectin type III domain protein
MFPGRSPDLEQTDRSWLGVSGRSGSVRRAFGSSRHPLAHRKMKQSPRIISVLLAILFASCVTAPPPAPPPKKTPVQKSLIVKAANPLPQSPATVVTRTLTWEPNLPAEQISAYNVYEVIRRTNTTPPHWAVIGTVTTPSLTLDGLVVGSFHVYTVTAVNANGESLYSLPLIYRVN